jgi:hypothetical protein
MSTISADEAVLKVLVLGENKRMFENLWNSHVDSSSK